MSATDYPRRSGRGGAGRILILGLLTCIAFVSAGCAAGAERIRLDDDVVLPKSAVVVFFVDGLDKHRLNDMLAEGDLPNIRRWFIEGGVGVEHAVSVLPSITYAASVSFLTGLYPGHHGVLGNRWFDPDTCTARYYVTPSTYRTVNQHFHRPTLYEVLEHVLTVSVQFHTRRGVTWTKDNAVPTGLDYFWHEYWLADRRVGTCVADVARFANRAGRWPAVYWNYFPGNDETAHYYGSDSEEYRTSLRTIDHSIGQIIGGIEQAGMGDRTYFVLVTDHGHDQTQHEFDLPEWLRQNTSYRVFEGTITDDDYLARLRRLDDYDAVVLNGAFRRMAIHLRGRNGWGTPVDPEHLRMLACDSPRSGIVPLCKLEAVALVCYRIGPDEIAVATHAGSTRVQRRMVDGVKQYRIVPAEGEENGSILLGYAADPRLADFVARGWHASREWLAATAESRFPDFVPQVVEMFDSRRAGDVVAFAEKGWTFEPGDKSGHGSCVAADMVVPMYFAGVDLPRGARISYARLVDIMPTIIDLLSESDRLVYAGALDGVSIAQQLRAATAQNGQQQ